MVTSPQSSSFNSNLVIDTIKIAFTLDPNMLCPTLAFIDLFLCNANLPFLYVADWHNINKMW